MASGIILGDWTHRRCDMGGTRALYADVARAKPSIAWMWNPSHGGRVDQIRIAGECVYVATMGPRDAEAPGWERATLFALEASTGRLIGRRELPDPVPVAAMAVSRDLVHVVATRREEPIFSYGLRVGSLAPVHRRQLSIERDPLHEDVLDAWAAPDGSLWLELESVFGGARAYAIVGSDGRVLSAHTHQEDAAGAEWGGPPRDASWDGHALFVPIAGIWRPEGGTTPPSVWKVEACKAVPVDAQSPGVLAAPERDLWMRSALVGPGAKAHVIAASGAVHVVVVAEDLERSDRGAVEVQSVEASTLVLRSRAQASRVSLRGNLGEAARVSLRPNGELLYQSVRLDGTGATDLLCIKPDGNVDTLPLGNGRKYVVDASLGDTVLAHHEGRNGKVTVAAFGIDREGRLLGRRASAQWTIDTPDLGGSTTIYAGAGRVFVRGARGLAALSLD